MLLSFAFLIIVYKLSKLTTGHAINYTLEIATTDFATVRAAAEGGADRIELCAALNDGGTTPSLGMIKVCRDEFDVQLFPIIRPRAGDFLYNEEEYEIMRKDILLSKQVGCDGVVIGLLNTDGSVDVKRTAKLVQLAYPLEVTFHRAFDRCKDPFEAMEQLIESGCTRILTSGQQLVAIEGAELIAKLVEAADERIVIMPGSGVRKENIKELAQKTGAIEFHSSLRSQQKTKMNFLHPAFANSKESYSNPFVDPSEVRALRNALLS